MFVSSICRRLFRLKTGMKDGKTRLDKCLSTFDLTALGVGSTLGIGFLFVSGSLFKDVAGPSGVLSLLLAGILALLTGLCYGELGARMPKAGSAYVYSYVALGRY